MKLLLLTTLLTLNCFAQNPPGNCGSQWLKADYTGLQQAQTASATADAVIAANTAHDTVIAKAYTTAGIYMDFNGQRKEALTSYNKALEHLQPYKLQQIYVYINKAIALEQLNDYQKMFTEANKAMTLSNKYGTPVTTALVYQTLATYYFRTDNMAKSSSYLLKGIAILEKQNNRCYLPLLKLSLANTYIQTNNYQFAADLFKEYLDNNTNAKGSKQYTIAIVNYTECLIELNQLEKAFTLLENALPDVKLAGDKELEAVLYYRLANLENRRERIESSLTFYKRAYVLLGEGKSRFSTNIFTDYLEVLNKAKKFKEAGALMESFKNSDAYRKSTTQDRFEYEQSAAAIYNKTGNLKEANRALTEALRLCDSLRQVGNGLREQEVQAQYQTKVQREQNIILEKRINRENLLIVLYIILSLAIIIIGYMYIRGYRLRHRLNKERFKNTVAEKNLAQQQRDYEQELSNSQKTIIDEKQREVTSMALRLASYYDHINDLVARVNNSSNIAEIKKELQQIVKQKDYWNQFETRFNNLNPEFASSLVNKYPKLTKNDVEFCSLIKLKLTNKEIASLLQISHESVITKKYRIRKKMELQDDADFEKLLSDL
ncbi:tetratricopeptide repeat protein [Flavobacterium subsaxonicum]|uniref:HTH luxR-type domain-containing protein n=1 Tax=Flavobacterium subsaxonicum WB 4.1-42 = DSM 21790 TaxID=1121898 RepID=A0A0A2MSB2_9FLAO|nr:hypothetical protein [Flavobacterium subsaxonicum]KGO91130.1 hypothetical protein Q766_19390 [Flavobacterium subsaxonicum WB 4.1-42 = DSM 21790]